MSEKKLKAIRDKYTQTAIIKHISEETALSIKEVKSVFASLSDLSKRHIMKRGSGEFSIPEVGVKITRKTKPATKKRKGRNPATGEEMMIAAKPKREVIKVSAMKKLKDVLV